MSATHQLSLFPSSSPARPKRCPLDESSERLLDQFRHIRLANGIHPSSIAREVSQLRSVAREGGNPDTPLSLTALVTDMGAVARALREPCTSVARSTNCARFLAIQQFIAAMGPTLGIAPDATLDALDALLPKRADAAWHRTGIMIAGTAKRRQRRGPSLEWPDLRRIIEAAADRTNGFRMSRDRALVALHCFSGLWPGEISRLQWQNITRGSGASGEYITATVERDGKLLHLPILGPAADAVGALVNQRKETIGPPQGFVFRATMNGHNPISYRAARMIIVQACTRAGLPPVEAVALRAAFAYWLGAQGFSDHEVAAALGIARVRTVDSLLRSHRALSAQRRVREMSN